MKKRELAAVKLLAQEGGVRKVDDRTFLVRSQSDPSRWYRVTWGDDRWECDCPDFLKRRRKCKHIYAVGYHLARGELASSVAVRCPECGSPDVVRRGMRHNRRGPVQTYSCKRCGVRFTPGAFRGMRCSPSAIVAALDLFFRGISTRQIAEHLRMCYGIKVSHSSVHGWIRKYTQLVGEHLSAISPRVGERWHADETVVRVGGRHMNLWMLLDSETRFLIAARITEGKREEDARALLREGAKKCSPPTEIVTDGNPSYIEAVRKEIPPDAVHISAPLSSGLNNRIERLCGTIKDRLKAMRGFRNERGAEMFVKGFALHYNFVREHKALGRTPAEEAGLRSMSWTDLLETASQHSGRTGADQSSHGTSESRPSQRESAQASSGA